MAKVDVKFMKGDRTTAKGMGATYGKKKTAAGKKTTKKREK